jgi:hypothetical protein
MAVLERQQDASAAEARLVAEACLRAAAEAGLSKEELGAIVGRHRTSLERSGLPPESKEGQLGLLFLRVMRSLDNLVEKTRCQVCRWHPTWLAYSSVRPLHLNMNQEFARNCHQSIEWVQPLRFECLA